MKLKKNIINDQQYKQTRKNVAWILKVDKSKIKINNNFKIKGKQTHDVCQ